MKTSGYYYAADAFRHPHSIRLIVKIQAVFRGFLERKRVRKLKEANIYHGMHMNQGENAFNYDNPDVIVSSSVTK